MALDAESEPDVVASRRRRRSRWVHGCVECHDDASAWSVYLPELGRDYHARPDFDNEQEAMKGGKSDKTRPSTGKPVAKRGAPKQKKKGAERPFTVSPPKGSRKHPEIGGGSSKGEEF